MSVPLDFHHTQYTSQSGKKKFAYRRFLLIYRRAAVLFSSPVNPDHTYQRVLEGFFFSRKEKQCLCSMERMSVFGFCPCGKNVFVEETFVILTDREILACKKSLQLLVDHRKLLMLH